MVILILIVLALLLLGWAVVKLIALPLGGVDSGIAIFYGFLLVIIALGVLAWRGRKKQAAARAARASG